MESTPINTSSDEEGNFGAKKKRKRLFESAPDDDAQSLHKSRHIAREALRHEEAKKPAPLFSISEALLPKPKEESPETEDSEETLEVEDLDATERRYAAQALRRESRQQRGETEPDANQPDVIAAGDLLVDEWDDHIEAGQDFDEALHEILQEHDIAYSAELFEDTAEPELESEPSWRSEVPKPLAEKTDYAQNFDSEEVVISTHENQSAQSSPSNQEITEQPSEHESDLGDRPAPAEASQRPITESKHESPTPKSVIGNITDYFVGRRGNAKNDGELPPAKKKIEKQVDDLSWELKAKEAKIRQVAAEHVRRKGPAALETMIAEASPPERPRPAEPINEAGTERQAPYLSSRLFERRERAPEANKLHAVAGAVEAPGHIGHVLVGGEAAKRAREVTKITEAPERIKLPPNKRIETLSRPELLAMSERITVEGSTLRNVYETHLIGEQALRRLVAEYLHGGDVIKALQREIVEHEIDFERDPALRDLAVPGESDDTDNNEVKQLAAPGKEALNRLLQKAEAGIDANGDENFVYDKTEPKDNIDRPQPKSQNRKPVDTIMGAIIIMLIFLVGMLYLWHR